MCDCPDKDIKFPNWSCVIIVCSKCPGVFSPDAEINVDEDIVLQYFSSLCKYKLLNFAQAPIT